MPDRIKRQIHLEMENDTEFLNIGKRTPYKVPAGFFDQVSSES